VGAEDAAHVDTVTAEALEGWNTYQSEYAAGAPAWAGSPSWAVASAVEPVVEP
jgi:hypothetical protein